MIQPDFQTFKKMCRKGNVIPVTVELPADLETPVSVFLKLARHRPHSFLLESVELGERLGRFSLIGLEPSTILEYANGRATITERGHLKSKLKAPFLEVLQRQLSKYKFVADRTLPPLVGGFVGYIGYELVQQFEAVKLARKKGLSVPDSVLFFPTTLIVFDHIKHTVKLVQLAMVKGAPKRAYEDAVATIRQTTQMLARPIRGGIQPLESHRSSRLKISKLRSNMTQKKYEAIVNRAKEYIRAGDCIQIVLSQRFDLGHVDDDFKLFRALRSLNPSPYMFYFRHKQLSLVGSSPEMLTRKTNGIVEVRPIAGTRPRGKTETEDLAYEKELRASTKEMAEHLMLVDLGRNDLGRVCQTKSVTVPDYARTERYSHVMHLVSDVQATLKKGNGALDLLKATFPAGTVTGAPKIRAMEIIDELETDRRGPYAGSLGYFSLTGDMDMCITIRTIVIHKKRASVQAGAGIVNDSVPHHEYLESINKAKALLQSVALSRGSP